MSVSIETLLLAKNLSGEGGGGGSSITVDNSLSKTSTHPVQNKVITAELEKKMPNVEWGEPLLCVDTTIVSLTYDSDLNLMVSEANPITFNSEFIEHIAEHPGNIFRTLLRVEWDGNVYDIFIKCFPNPIEFGRHLWTCIGNAEILQFVNNPSEKYEASSSFAIANACSLFGDTDQTRIATYADDPQSGPEIHTIKITAVPFTPSYVSEPLYYPTGDHGVQPVRYGMYGGVVEAYARNAYGYGSHSEGLNTFARGFGSHAEGIDSGAAYGSHAEGIETYANGNASHTEGTKTVAYGDNQHVFGKANISDYDGEFVEIVGNGTIQHGEIVTRSNARTLDWNGNEVLAGKLTLGAGPTNANDAATKTYVDTVLNGKIDVNQGSVNAGKFLAVGLDGTITLVELPVYNGGAT